MFLWKKKTYFLCSAAALAWMCLMGTLGLAGAKAYSVLDAVRGLVGDAAEWVDARTAFDSGITSWRTSIVLPVTAVPFVSHFSAERKSRYFLYVKARAGTARYLGLEFLRIVVGEAVVLGLVFGGYAAVVLGSFPLNAAGGEATALGLFLHIMAEYLSLLAYGTALSMLAASCIYLHNDLYVGMSLIMGLNYICLQALGQNAVQNALTMAAASGVLYLAVRKARKGEER